MILLGAAVLCAGCQNSYWTKPGTDTGSYGIDRGACVADAFEHTPWVLKHKPIFGVPYDANATQRSDQVNACMQSAHWRIAGEGTGL